MITTIDTGNYKLIETKDDHRVLYLDNKAYVWMKLLDIGEILEVSKKTHKSKSVLSMGRFNLYEVKDEPKFSDLIHLELEFSDVLWQGYLLLTGLPDNHKLRGRIIPTDETITRNRMLVNRRDIRANLAKDLER